jgi:hypothetical protein
MDDDKLPPTDLIIERLRFAKADVEKMGWALGLHVPGGIDGSRHEIGNTVGRIKLWLDDAASALRKSSAT